MNRRHNFASALHALISVLALAIASLSTPTAARPAPPFTVSVAERVADIDWLMDKIEARYAYLNRENVDLDAIRSLYRQEAIAATTNAAWLHVLENLVANLHDHHVDLNRNVASSPQLVPSGTDIWADVESNRAIITQVRPDIRLTARACALAIRSQRSAARMQYPL